MGNLINSIPVYRPQQPAQQPQAPAAKIPAAQTTVPKSILQLENPFPQLQTYTYAPARPLSEPHTTPKGVKPQAASGYLVKENIFQSAASTVKSYADYLIYFYKAAFKGEGTDYSVGKINDLAIRTGSLGIAAVLATSKMFPFAKGMEFIGLGTWFASMAVWPHILGAPIKALYGVDINQKYIDSYGRRKYVYEDNQYRPMDIYRHVDLKGRTLTPEEYNAKYDKDYVYLDKIGNKLGIPKDINNRNEATMNKMGQVAVQGKTLWMLTAGVMTPVISSIVADALQNPLKNHLEKSRYKKQEAKLETLNAQVGALLDAGEKDVEKIMTGLNVKISPEAEKQFNSLLTENGQMTKAQFKNLESFLEKRFWGTGFYESIHEAMSKNLKMTEPIITVSDELKTNITKITSEAVKEAVEKLPQEVKNNLPDMLINYEGLSAQDVTNLINKTWNAGENKAMDLFAHEALRNTIPGKTIENLQNSLNGVIDEDLLEDISAEAQKLINKKTAAYWEEQKRFVVPKDTVTKLFKFAEINNNIKTRIDEFEKTSIKNISESITANNWGVLPKKYLKLLGFNKGELAIIASADANTASKVIAKKLEEVAKNPEQYKKAITEMSKLAKDAATKEEKAVIKLIGSIEENGILSKIKELMKTTAETNFGHEMKNSLERYYDGKFRGVQRKFRNTFDSFVRPIKALDFFKHIDEAVVDFFKEYNAPAGKSLEEQYYASRPYTFHNTSYEEAQKVMKEYLEDAILQKNDINNWTTKFEHEVKGTKRGFKFSVDSVRRIAEAILGDLCKDTAEIINDKDFVNKINTNNQAMKARFLRIENELTKTFTTTYNWFHGAVEAFANGDASQYDRLAGLLEDRRSNITPEEFNECKGILNTFKRDGAKAFGDQKTNKLNYLKGKMDFFASNRSIAEMTGKNVTDFFTGAAQELRARSKWANLVYGLLIGTVGLSAVTIALMGKKNYFNKDIYEPKQTEQGAGN